MHHRSVQALTIEMYKVKNDFFASVTRNIFCRNTANTYNLKNQSDFRVPDVRIECHASERTV